MGELKNVLTLLEKDSPVVRQLAQEIDTSRIMQRLNQLDCEEGSPRSEQDEDLGSARMLGLNDSREHDFD